MNFWVTYPLVAHPYNPEFLTKDSLTRFSVAAEAAGFSGIGFTDHPAPSERWLAAGGHDALDPLTALAFCAAVTDRPPADPEHPGAPLPQSVPGREGRGHARRPLRRALHTRRRHGLSARGIPALGVDYDRRNALFDEAIEVILGVWSKNDFAYQGATFAASGQTANPKPDPLPPIWIGGNSRQSRQRVARYGQGWSPFPAPRSLASPRNRHRSSHWRICARC